MFDGRQAGTLLRFEMAAKKLEVSCETVTRREEREHGKQDPSPSRMLSAGEYDGSNRTIT